MYRTLARVSLFRALNQRTFALLWTGQTISRLGDYLYEIALAWWVLRETGSPLAMAGVLICAMTPMLLFLLIGGVAVDRFSRPHLMLASDLARGVVVSVVALLAFSGGLTIWYLYAASLVFGFVDAFFQPAYAALVPDVVARDNLPSANSLSSLSTQLGRIAGPALGAGIVALGGTPVAFAFNALTFFISAAFLAPLLGTPAPSRAALEGETEPRASILADLRAGLGTVARSPFLWLTITLYALTNVTLAGPYSIALPFLVTEHLHSDVGTLGTLYAIFPIGYIIGGIWLGRKAQIRHRGWLNYGSVVVAGLMLGAFGLPIPVLLVGLAALINGGAIEAGNLAWVNILQDPVIVPPDTRGRVSSIELLGSYVLLPIGYGLTGWLTPLLGPAPVFLLGGSLTALVAALGLLHPAVRNLD